MNITIIKNENAEQTIGEFLRERNRIADCIYDLDRLNQQHKHDEEFMQQLKEVVIRARNNYKPKPE